MITDWKVQLENFNSLLKELRQSGEKQRRLRFDRLCVVASDVAEQFYCEKKVEMQYFTGKLRQKPKTVAQKPTKNSQKTR
jgi:hypothetical protein